MPPVMHHFGFVVLYVMLDAASFIHPLHDLNITPWNPAPALGIAYVMQRGWPRCAVLFATILLSDILIRGSGPVWWSAVVGAVVLALGYAAIAEVLRRSLPPGTLLESRHLLWRWFARVAAGSFLVSITYISMLSLLRLLPPDGWSGGVLRFWVGDLVGMAVTLPLLWWLASAEGRAQIGLTLRRAETYAYAAASLVMVVMAFGFGAADAFKYFYLLFIPVVWASARQGMVGAVLSATLVQLEVILAVQLLQYSAVTVAELQLLALAIALIGFFIGATVDEQRRASDELRQSLRLAAAGEMAGALAHELNQPLTALDAYGAACETLLQRGETGERLQAGLRGMMTESRRASEVVRRLRDFFRTGNTRLQPVVLRDLVDVVAANCRRHGAERGIALHVGTLPDRQLYADPLQIELVLRNLLANACDAAEVAEPGNRWVRLSVEDDERNVVITVEDSGSGLDERKHARLFEPFFTDKASGLGLGLAISKAIVETHGGTLACEPGDRGLFRLSLPLGDPAPCATT